MHTLCFIHASLRLESQSEIFTVGLYCSESCALSATQTLQFMSV